MPSKIDENEFMLSHADYIVRNNEPIVVLRGVDERGESNIVKVKGFEPYFYVRSKEYKGNDLRKKDRYETINGEEVVKVKTNTPRDVSKQRDKYSKTWESDVLFPVRYLVDKEIRSGFKIENGEVKPSEVNINQVKPTKLFFDIETSIDEDTTVDLDPDKTNNRIVTIVCRYINENAGEDVEKVIHNDDEKEMLLEFIDFVNEVDPDMLLAWNVYFDIGNIFNRTEKYNIDINELSPVNEVYKRGHGDNKEVVCKGRLVIDLMESYDRFYTNENLESKALEDVCKDEVDIDHSDFDYSKLEEGNWSKHIDEIIQYNKLDVERMVKLDKELRIIEHFEQLRRETGCLFEQSYRTSGFVDVLMLRYFKDKYVLPRAERKDKKKFKGGFVELFTGAGLYNWVAVLDFSAHYPTAIKNYNISPETMTDTPRNAHTVETPMADVHFVKEPKGILPKMLDDISEMRNKLKRKRDEKDKDDELWEYYHKRQYTMKQLINSFFGYFGYPGSRLYIPELGAAVTRAGRKYIEDTVKYAKEQLGYQSRYSDTDCLFLSIDEDTKEKVVEAAKELEEKINDYWKERAEEEDMYGRPKIECEKIYKRVFFKEAKKRYSGRKIWEEGKYTDELDITGFEVVRRDESKPTKDALRGLFEIIFSDKGEEDKDVKESEIPDVKIQEMKDHLEDIRKSMENPNSVEDIAKPKPIRMVPSDYSVPYTVHGIIWSNRNLDKSFGITDSKPYVVHIKKLPEEYGNLKVKCPHPDKEKLFVERDLTRIALSKDDDINEWIDYIDIDKHYQKQVVNKVEDIFECIGLSYSEVKNCTRQKSLEDF